MNSIKQEEIRKAKNRKNTIIRHVLTHVRKHNSNADNPCIKIESINGKILFYYTDQIVIANNK